MKNPVRSLVLILLSCLLIVGPAAGCKQKGGESSKAGPESGQKISSDGAESGDLESGPLSTSGNTQESSAASKATGSGVHGGIVIQPNEKTPNLGGKKLVIASPWKIEPEAKKNALDDKIIKRIKMSEQKYNCKIEYKVVEGDFGMQFVTAAAAGTFFSDIVYNPTVWSYPVWFKNNYFAPLDGFVDYKNEKYKVMDKTTIYVDGKHYALCTPDVGPYVVVYNKDILQRSNCPDPLTLAQEGKWNWNTFLDIAKKTTTAGNSQYGVGGNPFNSILESNGVKKVEVGAQKLSFGLTTPAAMEALNFYADLYRTHKVAETDMTDDWKSFRDGKAAMNWGYLWEVKDHVVGRRSNVPFKIVPVPLGPSAKKRIITPDNLLYVSFPVMSNYDVRDRVMIYLDAYGTGEKSDAATYVDPYNAFKTAYGTCFKTSEELDFYWDEWQKSEFVFTPTGGATSDQAGGMIWTRIMSPLRDGNDTAATLIEANKNRIQSALDALLK